MNHDALEVEPSVAEVEDQVHRSLVGVLSQIRARAPQDLALGQRRDLRHDDFEPGLCQGRPHSVDGRVELDGPHHRDRLAGCEVPLQRRQEVCRVDADVDKDVERLDLGDVDRDEARVGIVHEEVAAHRPGRVVVDAARAVGHVAHDEGFDARAKLLQDVGYGGGEEQQTLWHLQCDPLGAQRPDPMDGLGNLERVVCWEERNGSLELGVLEDLRRHLVQETRSSPWLGNCRMLLLILDYLISMDRGS